MGAMLAKCLKGIGLERKKFREHVRHVGESSKYITKEDYKTCQDVLLVSSSRLLFKVS